MKKHSKLLIASTLAASTLFISACGGGGGGGTPPSTNVSYDAKATIDNVADNIITKTYTDLDTAAAALLAAVQALQAGGATEPEMDTAQAAWIAARVPWESSEGFLFGPVDSLGIDPAIDSWPLNTADLVAFMASNPDQTAIEAASDDVRGFHAIEWLLFGDGVADNEKTAAELTPGEMGYLIALAQAFKAQTGLLASSWTTDFNGAGPYATILKTPGAGQTFASQGAVMEELIAAMSGIADEVANAKIAEPLGTAAPGDTSKVESQYSWNSLTDFHNNIQSIMNVYTGKQGYDWQTDTISSGLNGVYAFVEKHDPALALRVLTEITDAQKAIALVKGDGIDTTTDITGTAKPFREQIKDAAGRALIQTAIDAVNTIMTTLNDDVIPLIGKTDFAG
ncbi:MAG TPA: iron-regulated protein A precursor [Chromatiales bacterium]|nr:iron-regulated protein A precursor [Thiotrichales bacterium]HIP67801.1 iron-regulated protein A precursor [Chromatiales bacterium]